MLSKKVSAVVDNYGKGLVPELSQSKSHQTSNNVRPETPVQVASNYSFINETQSLGSASQPNAASETREILETDNESVHESVESAEVDDSTQDSSISDASYKEKIGNDERKETTVD